MQQHGQRFSSRGLGYYYTIINLTFKGCLPPRMDVGPAREAFSGSGCSKDTPGLELFVVSGFSLWIMLELFMGPMDAELLGNSCSPHGPLLIFVCSCGRLATFGIFFAHLWLLWMCSVVNWRVYGCHTRLWIIFIVLFELQNNPNNIYLFDCNHFHSLCSAY